MLLPQPRQPLLLLLRQPQCEEWPRYWALGSKDALRTPPLWHHPFPVCAARFGLDVEQDVGGPLSALRAEVLDAVWFFFVDVSTVEHHGDDLSYVQQRSIR